jgi:hypothetical protein
MKTVTIWTLLVMLGSGEAKVTVAPSLNACQEALTRRINDMHASRRARLTAGDPMADGDIVGAGCVATTTTVE